MEDQDLSFGQAEARLWVKWVAANFVAALFAEVLSILVARLTKVGPAIISVSFISWLLWGLSLAFMQWLVLRRWLPRARGWLVATTVGAITYLAFLGLATDVGTATSRLLANILNVIWGGLPDVWLGIASGALLGATIGFTQWIVLRRRFLRAGWWILACAAGWTVAALLGHASQCLQLLAQPAPGAITGIALVWLVRQTLGEGAETVPGPEMLTCPHCCEQVPSRAAVCRHCQGWLVDRPQAAVAGEKKPARGIVHAVRHGVPRSVRWAAALGALAALALPTVSLVARAMACGPFHSSVIMFAILALTSSAPAGALPAVLAWVLGRRRDGGTANGGDFSLPRAVAGGVLGVIIGFTVSATCAFMTFFPECL
jgi:hypothetical protein